MKVWIKALTECPFVVFEMKQSFHLLPISFDKTRLAPYYVTLSIKKIFGKQEHFLSTSKSQVDGYLISQITVRK